MAKHGLVTNGEDIVLHRKGRPPGKHLIKLGKRAVEASFTRAVWARKGSLCSGVRRVGHVECMARLAGRAAGCSTGESYCPFYTLTRRCTSLSEQQEGGDEEDKRQGAVLGIAQSGT